MITEKTLKAIEYDKVLERVAQRAVLDSTKAAILSSTPASDLSDAEFLLKKTSEAYKLLYTYNVSEVYYFDDISEILKHADMGGTLINGELLKVAGNLKSARILKNSIITVKDENIKLLSEIAKRLYVNQDFEKEITSKIISEDSIADSASPRLAEIRKQIAALNIKIRDRLNSYIKGSSTRYLQDSVVTVRRDRYVIPVKAEYRSFIKGFVHDQSASGATVFIEPEQVMDLNNDLKTAFLDESNEIRRILSELSAKVALMSDGLRYNAENISEIDESFAKAVYSFENKCTFPVLNDVGIIDIKRGRHPLIDSKKVVPIDISLGDKYKFLLITGPNTGGKTVTLKLTGILTLMAMTGLYIPASDDSKISFFEGVYCDIGDEQSIEQSLSTFSSHIKNIKNILGSTSKEKSLILLDEIGAGTDPEEGSALALAIIEKLLSCDCYGIITTHYSKLKEFAAINDKIENASMEFDAKTLMPVYKLNIGIPGSSNAIDIAKILGIEDDVITSAVSHLSDDKTGFEKVLKQAEESRRSADALVKDLDEIKKERASELEKIKDEKEKIAKIREKIYLDARRETKSIVADKLSEAEEIIAELKDILKRAGLESREVFKAGELRNRLQNSRYLSADIDDKPMELENVEALKLKKGDRVYVNSLNAKAEILSINERKKEAEVLIGDMKTVVKFSELFNKENPDKKQNKVSFNRGASALSMPLSEINIIGKTALEAETILNDFIDQAVLHNLEEIKVIHGVGSGVLLKTVRDFLKKDKRVKEFRRGKYGEGENGVTIITLK